ncbi:hypothetical protein ACFC58_13515 [Kitasatospora purpeofusca]|uniref:hypothetical protein n=1 Tax=Kitasatospora purpeofusca TaxID=67352 RepID=UPI0035DD3AFC
MHARPTRSHPTTLPSAGPTGAATSPGLGRPGEGLARAIGVANFYPDRLFELDHDQMAAVAALETGTTLFFDQHDPEMVAWLSKRRLEN